MLKIIWLNDWAQMRNGTVAGPWFTLLNIGGGSLDLEAFKIKFTFVVLGLGFQIQDGRGFGTLAEHGTPVEITREIELKGEHPLAAHDPFGGGPIPPKQIKAALDRIMLEHGPVCTTRCGTHKCAKTRARLDGRINGTA